MAYTWDNRVQFVITTMYDIDNNGFLDQNDFVCQALRHTLMEGKGSWNEELFDKNKAAMLAIWDEITTLADFNKDGKVSVDEFKAALDLTCKGKSFEDLPKAFSFFIESAFRSIDINGDGLIGLDEFRLSCAVRQAYRTIEELDDAFRQLLNNEDQERGGIDLNRFKELYAKFIGEENEETEAKYLFGPLQLID